MEKKRLEVTRPNELYIPGGGYYDMKNAHHTERLVAKLGLLTIICSLAAEDMSSTGEMLSIFGGEIEKLAEGVYEVYRPAIERGNDVFGLERYWDKRNASRYANREVIYGYHNASPEERTEGLPDGWWYNHPGYAEKMFEHQFIVIGDVDGPVRVDILDPHDPETLQYIHDGDFSRIQESVYCKENFESTLRKLLPGDVYDEVLDVVGFVKSLQTETEPESDSVVDRIYNHIAKFDLFAATYLLKGWHLEHTGGGCWVAYIEVMLKDGKTVSLGVNNESIGLYACKWDEDDGSLDSLFYWEPEEGTDSLKSKLETHIGDAVFHNALLGNALTIMYSEFF